MLEYPFFAQGNVVAFSTMRDDGDTDAATLRPDEPYAGFNATHYCGDSAEHVAQCRQWLTSKLGIANDRLLLPRQTHSDHVGLISSSFFSLPKARMTFKPV
ncbi:MAG: laccase domain-containing protein, partial [Bacteroidales bacterium]